MDVRREEKPLSDPPRRYQEVTRSSGMHPLWHLQRTAGNRAVGSLLGVQRSTLPSHVGMFSLELMSEDYLRMLKLVQGDVVPPIKKERELADSLKGFNITAEIDIEVMKQAAPKIAKIARAPGTQTLEAATTKYLEAYEDLDTTPAPDVEMHAFDQAVAEWDAAVASQAETKGTAAAAEDQKALDDAKKSIDKKAETVGVVVQSLSMLAETAVTGEGWGEAVGGGLGHASKEFTTFMLESKPEFKKLEEKVKAAQAKTVQLRTLADAKRVDAAAKGVAVAGAALERMIREITAKAKRVERASTALATELRAAGFDEAAGAIETRAAARKTSNQMLGVLAEVEASISDVMPEVVEVYGRFKVLRDSLSGPGPPLVADAGQRAAVEEFCDKAMRWKPLLENELRVADANKAAVGSGHFDKIYSPVSEILHGSIA